MDKTIFERHRKMIETKEIDKILKDEEGKITISKKEYNRLTKRSIYRCRVCLISRMETLIRRMQPWKKDNPEIYDQHQRLVKGPDDNSG